MCYWFPICYNMSPKIYKLREDLEIQEKEWLSGDKRQNAYAENGIIVIRIHTGIDF